MATGWVPRIPLHARAAMSTDAERMIVRVTRDRGLPSAERHRHALLVPANDVVATELAGFAAGLVLDGQAPPDTPGFWILLPSDLAYLDEGDIVRIDPPRQQVRVLYRRAAPHNSLLVTERCNSRCLMCSQPPLTRDDSYLVEELLQAIPLMAPDTAELAITGGETTLLQDDLIRLLTATRDYLPHTAVHVLSNGRLLAYLRYAEKIASVEHPDLMIGIPLYSDLPGRHDFVVQARGAFNQTVRGVLNLGRYRQRIEIRVVLHRQTYSRLPQLARFIARNLPFVEQVALMGLEVTGYTRANLEALWIDPNDYQTELGQAVTLLDQAGMRVSIYNHQLCVLDRDLWPFACKSISDWKNMYLTECETCGVRSECGGFFSSATVRHSAHIHPIKADSAFGR